MEYPMDEIQTRRLFSFFQFMGTAMFIPFFFFSYGLMPPLTAPLFFRVISLLT